jgi:hypothetical protein
MTDPTITPARLRELADLQDPPVGGVTLGERIRIARDTAAALRAAADRIEQDEAKYDELYGIHHDRMQALGNLLAIIHRDGGHHIDRVGYDQAVKDAHQVWAGLMSTLAARKALLVRASDILDIAMFVKGTGDMENARALAAEIAAALKGGGDE